MVAYIAFTHMYPDSKKQTNVFAAYANIPLNMAALLTSLHHPTALGRRKCQVAWVEDNVVIYSLM